MGAANSTYVRPPLPHFPLNSQLGEFHFPLACHLIGANISLDGTFYALGPVVANPGQEIYFSDSVSRIRIPEDLANSAALLNATRTMTKSFVTLDFENATPSSLQLFPEGLVVNSSALVPNETNSIRVPAKGVLPKFGPITIGEAGVNTAFFLGELISEITLFNADDKAVFGPYNLTCPPLAVRPELGLVNVVGQPNKTAYAPSLGYKPELASIKENQEVGYYHTSLSCDVGQYQDVFLDTILGGKLYGSYETESNFQLTDIQAEVIVPESLLSQFKSGYMASDSTITLDEIELGMTNASPLTKNILPEPLSLDAPVGGSSVTLTIPKSGALRSGNFTAGPNVGDFMMLSLNSVTGSVALSNSTGKITSLPVNCTPTYTPFALYGLLITPKNSTIP